MTLTGYVVIIASVATIGTGIGLLFSEHRWIGAGILIAVAGLLLLAWRQFYTGLQT